MPFSYRDSRGGVQILFVVPALESGGTEGHISALLPRLRESGYSVAVAVLRGGGPLAPPLRAVGVQVMSAPCLGGPFQPVVAGIWLVLMMARWRPHVIHFFLPRAYLIGGIVSLVFPGIRRVMSRRSLNNYMRCRRWVSWLERWLHGRMDRVLANSTAVRTQLLEEGVDVARLSLIANGVEPPNGLPLAADQREALDIPRDALVFATVANLFPYKGHKIALEALSRASGNLRGTWCYLIIGRDEGEGDRLRRAIHQLGLRSRVRVLGHRADVDILLRCTDIHLLPSFQEGSPHAVLEAMVAGAVNIASSIGGIPDLIDDGIHGVLVPPGDSAALARAIVELAGDADLRNALIDAAYVRVQSEFSFERCVSEYCNVYASLGVRRSEGNSV